MRAVSWWAVSISSPHTRSCVTARSRLLFHPQHSCQNDPLFEIRNSGIYHFWFWRTCPLKNKRGCQRRQCVHGLLWRLACSVHHQMTVTRHQTTWQVQGGHWTRSTWGRLHSLETPSVDLYPSHQKIRFQISLQLQLRHVSGAGPIVRWRPNFMVYGLWAMLAGGHCPRQPPWPAPLAGAGTMGTRGAVMLQWGDQWCCRGGTCDAAVMLTRGPVLQWGDWWPRWG